MARQYFRMNWDQPEPTPGEMKERDEATIKIPVPETKPNEYGKFTYLNYQDEWDETEPFRNTI